MAEATKAGDESSVRASEPGQVAGVGTAPRLPRCSGFGTMCRASVEAFAGMTFRTHFPSLHGYYRIDRATLSAIERLIDTGFLQLSEEGRRRLHGSPAAEPDAERERRLARARETFAQAERKIRMAAVLAEGGFPVEALPSLREGVELGVLSRAHLEGADPEGSGTVPLDWIESRLPRHLPLMRNLRGEPEALLATRAEDMRAWIAAGEQLAGEIRRDRPPALKAGQG